MWDFPNKEDSGDEKRVIFGSVQEAEKAMDIARGRSWRVKKIQVQISRYKQNSPSVTVTRVCDAPGGLNTNPWSGKSVNNSGIGDKGFSIMRNVSWIIKDGIQTG
eukprot:TRINITY_DN15165_c0_g2_i1.p1 TRINITY_DN15165_c0_g2~~TRINITY_DN15165_c0_g2_i1.p1  ORF type:complete len:105 (+),score=22.84 TRINITY_DN15165_c0_g2_i1:312-626(+)